MKSIIKLILVLTVIIIVVLISILGYLGFVPGISSILGADKPRDLGVKYSKENLQSIISKNGVKYEALQKAQTPAESIKYSGQKSVSNSYDDKEVSALINNRTWIYSPVTNAQIKFNSDGTAEFSATLVKDRIEGYVEAVLGSGVDISEITNKLKMLPVNPPIYIKGSAEVKDNKIVALEVKKLEVGKFSIPENLINENKDFITSFVEDRFKLAPGFFAKSVKLENSQLKFDGTMPEVEYTANTD